jgi:hypothetical protein
VSAIYQLLTTYCRGLDRGEMELVRAAYHPDAVDHHSGFDGGVDDFIAWVSAAMSQYASTAHYICNHSARVVGDRAVSETYNISVHRVDDPADSRNFTVGVRYIDRLEKRDERWGIVERWAVRDWVRLDAGQIGPLGEGPVGARGRHDASARALDWLDEVAR